jgi:hypothetical protein
VRIPIALAFTFFASSNAFAVDPTGLPECDMLLKRYETCSSELPPPKYRAAVKEILEASMSLRAEAKDLKKRADLERYCSNTFAQMKTKSSIKECMSK